MLQSLYVWKCSLVKLQMLSCVYSAVKVKVLNLISESVTVFNSWVFSSQLICFFLWLQTSALLFIPCVKNVKSGLKYVPVNYLSIFSLKVWVCGFVMLYFHQRLSGLRHFADTFCFFRMLIADSLRERASMYSLYILWYVQVYLYCPKS